MDIMTGSMLSPVFGVLFVGLVVAMTAGFMVAVRQSALRGGKTSLKAERLGLVTVVGSLAWLALTAAVARLGLLSFSSRPPSMLILLAVTVAVTVGLAYGPIGSTLIKGLPLTWLIGYQSFRIPVELLLHDAYRQGVVPVQMTFAGWNFDIVTGITAVAVAGLWAWGRCPRWLVLGWNVLGLGLLVNIVTIAILSAPVSFRRFHNEPANTWVTEAPWVWLPTVLVLFALLGHLLVFRALGRTRDGLSPAG